MMISLVITTYNRFESFLKANVAKYLSNPHVHEIVILDDCSDDYEKLVATFHSHPKLKLHRQPQNVGVYHNKVDAIKLAECDWICLMDSDNFCNLDYFEQLLAFWEMTGCDSHTIYCPVRAGKFDYTPFVDKPINAATWNSMRYSAGLLLNTGNNVFHRSVIPFLIKNRDVQPHACDVMYINYICVKNGFSLVVVPKMVYEHVIHDKSTYLMTQNQSTEFCNKFDWTIN